jgi:DNA-binding NarL/FixJ family response regulator
MERPIRLVIADDHRIFRQGLKSLLKSEREVTVVGETDHVGDLAGVLEETPCDMLLLDLQMERSVIGDIESLSARVPVIVLTASEFPPTRWPRSGAARAPSCSNASRSRR